MWGPRMGGLLLAAALGMATVLAVLPGVARATPSEEACFLASINAVRSAAGVGPVGLSLPLAAVARTHSQQMAASATISHNADLPNEAPSGWLALGENVGAGASCDAIARSIYADAPHRANLIDPRFDSVGVGVADGARAMLYVTEDFMGTGVALPPVPGETPPAGPLSVQQPASPAPTDAGAVDLSQSLAVKATVVVPGAAFSHPAGVTRGAVGVTSARGAAIPVAVPIVGEEPAPSMLSFAAGIIGQVVRAISSFFAARS